MFTVTFAQLCREHGLLHTFSKPAWDSVTMVTHWDWCTITACRIINHQQFISILFCLRVGVTDISISLSHQTVDATPSNISVKLSCVVVTELNSTCWCVCIRWLNVCVSFAADLSNDAQSHCESFDLGVDANTEMHVFVSICFFFCSFFVCKIHLLANNSGVFVNSQSLGRLGTYQSSLIILKFCSTLSKAEWQWLRDENVLFTWSWRNSVFIVLPICKALWVALRCHDEWCQFYEQKWFWFISNLRPTVWEPLVWNIKWIWTHKQQILNHEVSLIICYYLLSLRWFRDWTVRCVSWTSDERWNTDDTFKKSFTLSESIPERGFVRQLLWSVWNCDKSVNSSDLYECWRSCVAFCFSTSCFVETVFNVCLIYVSDHENKDKSTLDMYVSYSCNARRIIDTLLLEPSKPLMVDLKRCFTFLQNFLISGHLCLN